MAYMRPIRHSAILLSLFLGGAFTGCAANDDGASGGDDAGEARGVGGKADDNAVNCDDTALDDGGVCRRGNGQFAPAVCCAMPDECANATIDDGGTCRDTESGQFVPAACCDALCEGKSLINGFCRDVETGQFALAACCADQCFDLQLPSSDPVDAPPGSCADSCGDQSSDGECFCDEFCVGVGDCCADAVELCEDDLGVDPNPEPPPSNSCAGACDSGAPSGACFCDDACLELGDCCGDKVAQCGGEGSDVVVACEVDDCEGAEVDDNFICRKPNGQFALSACCGLDRCDDANLEIAEGGQALCRDDSNGQFVPMVCCDQRCQDAELDRTGICRNAVSGEFADPACCADMCFAAQARGDADAIDGCNGAQDAPE